MRITSLAVHNWRNFRDASFPVSDRLFIVGPNASGKSNLLDAVRFLRDVAADGGGLQAALAERGGLSRVRNLAARNHHKGKVAIHVVLGDDHDPDLWTYELELRSERSGKHRPIVALERVKQGELVLLDRPTDEDQADPERLTQTALEQVTSNQDFRAVSNFLADARYLNLVPQVIRDPSLRSLGSNDPSGSDFLLRVAKTTAKTRDARLRRINEALSLAVPQLESLALARDADNTPHLTATYKHWRKHGARQDERDFSDGTLRLVGLLWALQEGSGPVLLEEPELSLHSAVVAALPTLLQRAARTRGRQILVSTHAPQILNDEGLGLHEVVVLTPGPEGTQAVLASTLPDVRSEVEQLGLSLAESLLPRSAPDGAGAIASVALN